MANEQNTNRNSEVDTGAEDETATTQVSVVPVLFVFLVLFGGVYIIFFSDFLSVLSLRTKPGAIYTSTAVLVVFYGIILVASYAYKVQLEGLYKAAYEQHNTVIHAIPRHFAKWVLPIASILLVLVAQVITIPDSPDNTVVVSYEIAFVTARSLILLMIGMELAYFVQERAPGNRWPVLVTVSLILDFVSYFLLVAGHGPTSAVDAAAVSPRTLFVFLLGVSSFVSSYYTITQGRIADDVLRSEYQRGDSP